MNAFNKLIVKIVKMLPESVVYIFARKYIAGVGIDDAVKAVKELNAKGIAATIDVLGESIATKKEAEEAKKECLRVLDTIDKYALNANLSVKPTQLGLAIDKEFCFEQMCEILERARRYNNFVRVDMEDSPFTTLTIKLVLALKQKYSNTGVVVQAYLKRTVQDVVEMNKCGMNYRLCKGIYIEPAEIAYKDRQEVRNNYLKILAIMLDNGNYVGIATHDEFLIDGAYEIIKKNGYTKDKFEFQMLYGVRENLRNKINRDGYKIRIYVPFGVKWYAYSIRRLQENPQVAWYIFKSIFTFN